MALSRKQTVFIDEYLKCWNATQAAIRAGYPEKSARTVGSENLAKPDISAAIQKRLDENAMSANEVLQRLADHGRGTLADFVSVNESGWSVDLDKAQQAEKLHLLKKITRTEKTFKSKGNEETTVVTSIELHDVQNALTLLGKNLGIFSDQVKLINELDRALDLLETNLDDDTYRNILSILANSGVGGASAAKNREAASGNQE